MELNCLGMRCPLPIIKLAKALSSESEVTLLSDDPATLPDLIAWSRMTKHQFALLDTNKYLVKKL
ncbi:MAG: sulfurtransferase TusA family protein [Actinomycetes bacterium]|jgi:tRNA 2-thiouridine synthesizing protein A